MHVTRSLVVFLSLGLASVFASSKAAPSVRTAAAPQARSSKTAKPAAIPDGELEKAIRARFAASKISTHHFQVRVQGGVATIEGQTDVLQHKGTATRLAHNAGAKLVVNRVVVSQAAREKAAHNLEAGRRRAQVKRSDDTVRSLKRSN